MYMLLYLRYRHVNEYMDTYDFMYFMYTQVYGYGMACYGVVWYGMVRYGMLWYDR